MSNQISKDKISNPIWYALEELGCKPIVMENLGYTFQYSGYEGIYFTPQPTNDVARFAFPKLVNIDQESKYRISECVNMVNSMVTESKFTIMGNEVWMIFERFLSGNEDFPSIVKHILENLKNGAKLFHRFL